MTDRLRRAPGLTRAAALVLAIVAVGLAAPRFGQDVSWGIALAYGLALATSMRWPIIMPGGSRVVLISGVIFEALWHHGLATTVVIFLFEFLCRMVVVYRGRYYWEWYRPLFVLAAFFSAYGLQIAMLGGVAPDPAHRAYFHVDTPAFVMVYAFWVLLNASWAIKNGAVRGQHRWVDDLARGLQQTWWAPLTFLAVAWPLEWIHAHGYSVELLVCIGLVWLQSLVGPVFTTLNQDRAVNRIGQTMPNSFREERLTLHRVMRTANAIGRTLGLPDREMRLIGYTALLQNWGNTAEELLPLWLDHPLAPQECEQLWHRVNVVAERIETEGCLEEVANLVRHRYAAYDGTGCPATAGEAIPVAAQVVAAANAITALAGDADERNPEGITRSVEWLRTNAAGRFSPKVLWAAGQSFSERVPAVNVDHGLPEAVRQLQGLLGDHGRPRPLSVGIRRIWQQFWGRLGVAPDLPAEVQAMARLATYFASSTDIDRAAQITVDAVGQLFGAKVSVAIREKGKTELSLKCRAAYGFLHANPVGSMIYFSTGPLNRAILDQEPLQVSDLREIQTGLAQEVSAVEGVRSALFMPLIHRGQTLGLLFVGLQRQHWFTPREVGLIHLMAAQAAAAFENAQLIREAGERLEHITELKALTDKLLDNLSSSIIVVDPEGRVMTANAVARERFGSQMPVVIGQRLPEVLGKAVQIDRALASEATPEADWAWENAIFEVQSVPLRDQHGLMSGAICHIRDVTEVRSMEEQVRRVEKLAAIGELAAGAAHEIRNPLTSIRGFIQLLQHRASRADGDYFQIILNEIDRIDWIIRDMLLLARPTALLRVQTDLPGMLDELLLLHQSDLQRTNISVVKEFDPAVGLVSVDTKMFRQLMLNMILNAMQAMPYGGTLRLSVQPESDGQVAVQVADTGVGISPENLKRLFVPFFTTKEEGTGLGLALCYSIVQAHGGRIDVQSVVGHGTTFTIIMPVK